ncbi:MAG TPA: hypothetical protein VMI72_11705 [Roseiarcus sp.]|nr:hypothetical protein [Roseiarcus sp.]
MKSATILLAAAIVALGLALSSGIYTVIPFDRADAPRGVWVFNKFTGSQCWYEDVWDAACPESVRVTNRPRS